MGITDLPSLRAIVMERRMVDYLGFIFVLVLWGLLPRGTWYVVRDMWCTHNYYGYLNIVHKPLYQQAEYDSNSFCYISSEVQIFNY